jgi:phage gp36-like protein
MAYSSLTDLVNSISEEELIRLCGGEEIDEDKISIVLNFAQSLIDAYLFGKCEINNDDIPPLLKNISNDLAIITLSEWFYNFSELPNSIIRKKRETYNLLKDISTGKLNPLNTERHESIKILIKNISRDLL